MEAHVTLERNKVHSIQIIFALHRSDAFQFREVACCLMLRVLTTINPKLFMST